MRFPLLICLIISHQISFTQAFLTPILGRAVTKIATREIARPIIQHTSKEILRSTAIIGLNHVSSYSPHGGPSNIQTHHSSHPLLNNDRPSASTEYSEIVREAARKRAEYEHQEELRRKAIKNFEEYGSTFGKTFKEIRGMSGAWPDEVRRILGNFSSTKKGVIKEFQARYDLEQTGKLGPKTSELIKQIYCLELIQSYRSINQSKDLISPQLVFNPTFRDLILCYEFEGYEYFFVRNSIFSSQGFWHSVYASYFYKIDKNTGEFSLINSRDFFNLHDVALQKKIEFISPEATFMGIGLRRDYLPRGKSKPLYGLPVYFGDKTLIIPDNDFDAFIKHGRAIPQLDREVKKLNEGKIVIYRPAHLTRINYLKLVAALNKHYSKFCEFYLSNDFEIALQNMKNLKSVDFSFKIMIPDKGQKVNDFGVPGNLASRGVDRTKFISFKADDAPAKISGLITVGNKDQYYRSFLRSLLKTNQTDVLIDASCYEIGYENFLSELLYSRQVSSICFFSDLVDANALGYVVREFMLLQEVAEFQSANLYARWQMAANAAIKNNRLTKKMVSEIKKIKDIISSLSFGKRCSTTIEPNIEKV